MEYGDYIDAASAVMALPAARTHKAEVARFLAIAQEMAEIVAAVPLDEEAGPAPVFTPPDLEKRR